jgi:hypothetical protein
MRKPKDYLMAERGYNAFWNEQPTVWFDDLSHDYQMKWVRAAREMIKLHESYKHGPRESSKHTEEQRAAWRKYKQTQAEKAARVKKGVA